MFITKDWIDAAAVSLTSYKNQLATFVSNRLSGFFQKVDTLCILFIFRICLIRPHSRTLVNLSRKNIIYNTVPVAFIQFLSVIHFVLNATLFSTSSDSALLPPSGLQKTRSTLLLYLDIALFLTVCLHRTNRWVAIKIPTADSSSSSRECKVLQELEHYAEEKKTTLRSFHITRLLDHFVHKGPNGSHDCLVFPLLGPSTSTLINPYFSAAQYDDSGQYHNYIRPSIILRMTESLLKAVTFVYKCGFVHGGKTDLLIYFNIVS